MRIARVRNPPILIDMRGTRRAECCTSACSRSCFLRGSQGYADNLPRGEIDDVHIVRTAMIHSRSGSHVLVLSGSLRSEKKTEGRKGFISLVTGYAIPSQFPRAFQLSRSFPQVPQNQFRILEIQERSVDKMESRVSDRDVNETRLRSRNRTRGIRGFSPIEKSHIGDGDPLPVNERNYSHSSSPSWSVA